MNTIHPDILNTFRAAVHDVTLKESGSIHEGTKISELGLDSAGLSALIEILEGTLSIRINNEETAILNSVGDLLQLVSKRMPQNGGDSLKQGRQPVNNPQKWNSISGNGSCCDISQFPEVKKLEQRLKEFDRLGIKNPYFEMHDSIARNRTIIGGVEMLNFSSYNYLGFSGHPEVMKAAQNAIERYGTSVSASRLVSGERPIHRRLEKAIASHIGVEEALVFISGHATNVTTIGHLYDRNDLILHDSLSHDSIIQGIYLSGAKRKSFPHGEMDTLEKMLERLRGQYRRVLICSEGLFSMDGDICDLPRLIEIKKRFQCNLIIDEAHSIGVLGPAGQGVSHHYPGINRGDVDLWMGTLSKALASCGGYIAGSKSLIRYLKYTVPGFLFSVGMAPPVAAAALKSLQLMQQYPEVVEQLRRRSRLFLDLARDQGINTGTSIGAAVIPAIIGDSMTCVRASQALAAKQINVQPIIYPAVEENAARLRFFISATHSEDEIRYGVKTLAEELRKQ